MKLQDLTNTFALLMTAEPDSEICAIITRLAKASTATDEETDMSIVREVRARRDELEAELGRLDQSQLVRKSLLLGSMFE